MVSPMSWQLCFHIPKDHVRADGKRWVCVYVPSRDLPPERVHDPGPGPSFITHDKIGRQDAAALQTLAAIDRFAEHLPQELSLDIRESVTKHMQSFAHKFGEGIALSRFDANAA